MAKREISRLHQKLAIWFSYVLIIMTNPLAIPWVLKECLLQTSLIFSLVPLSNLQLLSRIPSISSLSEESSPRPAPISLNRLGLGVTEGVRSWAVILSVDGVAVNVFVLDVVKTSCSLCSVDGVGNAVKPKEDGERHCFVGESSASALVAFLGVSGCWMVRCLLAAVFPATFSVTWKSRPSSLTKGQSEKRSAWAVRALLGPKASSTLPGTSKAEYGGGGDRGIEDWFENRSESGTGSDLVLLRTAAVSRNFASSSQRKKLQRSLCGFWHV